MKFFLWLFANGLACIESYQFLGKVKAISSGKLLDSLPRNDAVAELYSGKFNMAYCRDPK
jgi:hypothetical protein